MPLVHAAITLRSIHQPGHSRLVSQERLASDITVRMQWMYISRWTTFDDSEAGGLAGLTAIPQLQRFD